MRTQPNIPTVPVDLRLQPVTAGRRTRGRDELVAQVQSPQSSITEGLAAEVENSLQRECGRPWRWLLPPLPVGLELGLAFDGPAGPPRPFGRWRGCMGCCCCAGAGCCCCLPRCPFGAKRTVKRYLVQCSDVLLFGIQHSYIRLTQAGTAAAAGRGERSICVLLHVALFP
jgi:hypothetical protein